MSNEEAKLKSMVEVAEKLHGHLGPFLVIGVRTGAIAQKTLNGEMHATVKVPFSTPFSCVIDGVQSTTKCTVGNQKLKIENSKGEIIAYFKASNPSKTLKITVNQRTVKEIVEKLSEGASSEELAWEIARKPEHELFKIETQ
ncbi:MAG: formylmethanofuran dehydrogenase subunit E family protein [Candidatus Bathyarchaeia archaeon]